MGLLTSNKHTDHAEDVFHFPTSKKLLLIFTRNPELGKCKTRLAAKVGDRTALAIYTFLLKHTVQISKNVSADKYVYYSDAIGEEDLWDLSIFHKRLQKGSHLGERMQNAFEQGFKDGYQKIVIIGSDLYDLTTEEIDQAFLALKDNDFVVGPAEDGGYYLLGMKSLRPALFLSKEWGSSSVLEETLAHLPKERTVLLPKKNDIDTYEDIKDIEVFQPFLKPLA
ncbi:MAG: TIGR04282 family arsenosugar biosynthesis glycosyltransferase [Flavobacteriaceae bacterium]